MTNQENPRVRDGSGKFIPTVDTAARQAEAARLRSLGKTYRAIAEDLGIDVHQAFDDVKNAMKAVVQEPAAMAIQFELDRLDETLCRLDEMREEVMAVLKREHVTVSQGHIVTMDDGSPVPDDDWILKAIDRLIRIEDARDRNGTSRRKLLGLDQPTKTQVSGGLTYEVVGVDPAQLT